MLRWRSWKEIPGTIKSITLLKKGLWKVFNVILLLLLLLFTKYSQLSPCGHLAITDTPITRTALLTPVSVISLIIRDGPLENLLGGGGGEEPKKYSRQGKLNEKKYIHARWRYSCYGLKKIHPRNLITKKQSLPHNFSNGPSLLTTATHKKKNKEIQLLERAMYIVRPYTHEKGKKFYSFKPFRSPVQFSSIFLSHYSQ